MDCVPCYRYNIFRGCPQTKACTIILRGGAEQFLEETERSLHDAIMVVRRAIKNDSVVAGVLAITVDNLSGPINIMLLRCRPRLVIVLRPRLLDVPFLC